LYLGQVKIQTLNFKPARAKEKTMSTQKKATDIEEEKCCQSGKTSKGSCDGVNCKCDGKGSGCKCR